MSWSYVKIGRASKMAEVVADHFAKAGGCPPGSTEESVKNSLGLISAALCGGFRGDPVVRIEAHGSAWNDGDKAHSQQVTFKFETLGDMVE